MLKKLILPLALLFLTCTAQAAPAPDYNQKAWNDLVTNLNNLRADTTQIALKKLDVMPIEIWIDGNKVAASNVLDLMRVVGSLATGEWAAARDQSVTGMLNFYFPLVGQYIALQQALKSTGEAILANWVQDLYATRAYRDMVDILNDKILAMAKDNQPFIPQFVLTEKNIEVDQGIAMGIGYAENDIMMRWDETMPFVELQQGGNPARLRKLFGKDPTEREVREHFYRVAVQDQIGFITATFERILQRRAEQAREKLYKDVARQVKQYMDRNSRPRAVTLATSGSSAFAGTARINFAGMPGYEYTVALYAEGGGRDMPLHTATVTAKGDSNALDMPFQLIPGETGLTVIVEDTFGKSEHAQVSLVPNTAGAVIQGFRALRISPKGPSPLKNEALHTDTLRAELDVPLATYDTRVKVWLQDANSSHVVHTLTVAAPSKGSAARITADIPLFRLNALKNGHGYLLCAQLAEPATDRTVHKIPFTYRLDMSAKVGPGESEDVHQRGLARWQTTVRLFVARIPACLGANFKNWATNELMKLGNDRNRQKYIGNLTLAERDQDRAGVFTHTGGFWADEYAKKPYDKCGKEWIENMRDAGFITWDKAWHAMNSMWKNSGWEGMYPGARSKEEHDKRQAAQRQKAQSGLLQEVPVSPQPVAPQPAAPQPVAPQPAPAQPQAAQTRPDHPAAADPAGWLRRTLANVTNKLQFACPGPVQEFVKALPERGVQTSGQDILNRIARMTQQELWDLEQELLQQTAMTVYEQVMRHPASSCYSDWVCHKGTYYSKNNGICGTYLQKMRDAGK